MSWRCFHCDEVMATEEAARLHFGASERHLPACTIDITEYRAMEKRMEDYNEDDAAIHREMRGMASTHCLELKREEEKGYGRAVADCETLRINELRDLAEKLETRAGAVMYCGDMHLGLMEAGKELRQRITDNTIDGGRRTNG